MSKALETKRKIMDLLKKRQMTISELSRELSLSTATVSQHMEELQKMGAVERVDNEHFKRLKYYKASQTPPVSMAKYVIVILLVAAAIGGYAILSYGATGTSQPQRSNGSAPPSIITTTSPQANASTTPIQPGGAGAIACPMMTYSLNGTITGYHGFSLYYVNSSNGGIPDYVTGSSGTFNVSERVTNVLNNNPAQFTTNRTHYAYLAAVNSTSDNTVRGINISISPEKYNVSEGEILNFTVSLAANSTAHGTYWMRIDGPCAGGVNEFLVTIGSRPYNGTIVIQPKIYA